MEHNIYPSQGVSIHFYCIYFDIILLQNLRQVNFIHFIQQLKRVKHIVGKKGKQMNADFKKKDCNEIIL